MTADTIQFVDAISSSPTVRLDINEQVSNWWTDFDPGSPRLRRASSANAMTDGIHVSSSSYDSRVLTFKSLLRDTTQDALATRFQALQRELDRPSNLIKYQPFGATKPVFFKTFRSDMSAIRVMKVSAATHELEFEVLAEPFALGLMETVSVGTVNNDPAHATNGCYFDIAAASVIGDVATPCLIVDTVVANSDNRRWAGIRQHGTPSNATYFAQAESLTLGAGVTNPGGAADGVMSGAGTTNYVRCDGVGADDTVTWTLSGTDAARIAQCGSYRLMAVLRTTASNTFAITMTAGGTGSVTTPSLSSNFRQLVDLGVVAIGDPIRTPGENAPESPTANMTIQLAFERLTGAGNIDLDYLQLVPADECSSIWTTTATAEDVFDAPQQAVYTKEAGVSLVTGGANIGALGEQVGGWFELIPNQTNRFIWIRATYSSGADTYTGITKANTSSLTVYYWPRYIFIRPSAT